MTSEMQEELKAPSLIAMSVPQLLRVASIGALTGTVAWGLTMVLDAYVFNGAVCQGDTSTRCATSLDYASAIGTIASGGLALLGLVRLQIFRALLVVLAATISLWGVETVLHEWTWQTALPVSIVLFAFAYSLFAWIARIRTFLTAAIIIVVLVVAVRFALNS